VTDFLTHEPYFPPSRSPQEAGPDFPKPRSPKTDEITSLVKTITLTREMEMSAKWRCRLAKKTFELFFRKAIVFAWVLNGGLLYRDKSTRCFLLKILLFRGDGLLLMG